MFCSARERSQCMLSAWAQDKREWAVPFEHPFAILPLVFRVKPEVSLFLGPVLSERSANATKQEWINKN